MACDFGKLFDFQVPPNDSLPEIDIGGCLRWATLYPGIRTFQSGFRPRKSTQNVRVVLRRFEHRHTFLLKNAYKHV